MPLENDRFFELQGKNIDGSVNTSYPLLIDYEHLIDYMLVIFYTGNNDAPATLSGYNPNNFFTYYDRTSNKGFRFITHDSEWTLLTYRLSNNVVTRNTPVTAFKFFQPQYLHTRLKLNEEYKIVFADRVYKHFFNEGALTVKKNIDRFNSRVDELQLPIIAESARWGDTWKDEPRNKEDHWLPYITALVEDYFPKRTNTVLKQLKRAKLYPDFDPPKFLSNDQELVSEKLSFSSNINLTLINDQENEAEIFYTLDGSDPRVIGGDISSKAMSGNKVIELTFSRTTILKSRLKEGDNWSALHQLELISDATLSGLQITEIHYHPLDEGDINDREFEFIEVKNNSINTINLTSVKFIKGIDYIFRANTILETGNSLVLSSNANHFYSRYGFDSYGEFNGQLDNNGERLIIVGALGDTITSVRYYDSDPWPTSADGKGYSLEYIGELNNDPNDAANWKASNEIHGNPVQVITGFSENKNQNIIPSSYILQQNYPNPFGKAIPSGNSTTIITYQISQTGITTLTIFDILGREVAELVNEPKSPGKYSVRFDATSLSSGIYFYMLKSKNFIDTKKMILLR